MSNFDLSCPSCGSMDIANLAGKKEYFCAHCAAGSFIPASAPRPEGAVNEQVFLQEYVNHTATGGAVIRITSHRAVLGDKTFALANISAVSLGDNKEQLQVDYNVLMAGHEAAKANSNPIVYFIVAAICVFIGFGMMADGEDGIFCLLAGVVSGIVGANQKAPVPPEMGRTMYVVRLNSAGAQGDAIWTTDKKTAQRVIRALNDAIVNLNVARRG